MPSHTEQDPPFPWSAFLDELDQAKSEPIELHCIGGFVVSLLYGLPRPTGDVDYVAAIPRYRTEELEQLAGRGSNPPQSTRFTYSMSPWQPCRKTMSHG
jgi:hypothetical protein